MPAALLQVVAGSSVPRSPCCTHSAPELADPCRHRAVRARVDRRRGLQQHGAALLVTPNEQVRETPFIQHNIAATRRAFALDTVTSAQCRATRG
jgi:hypothetical protein